MSSLRNIVDKIKSDEFPNLEAEKTITPLSSHSLIEQFRHSAGENVHC
jgi:hypothetical protein